MGRSPNGPARGRPYNLLAKGVRDAVAEKGVLGAFTGGFEAGAAGICAAIFFGLLVAMCFKSKDKQ